MTKAPQSHIPRLVMEHLGHDHVAASVLPTVERFLELEQDLSRTLPNGTPRSCVVCRFDAGILVLGVTNSAFLSKYRQLVPRIREALEGRGWKINAIQLRVQQIKSDAKSGIYVANIGGTEVPASALEHWSELAGGLEPSPLRDAVNALIARRQARVT